MTTDILIYLDMFVGIGFRVFSCCDWYERSRFEVFDGSWWSGGSWWSDGTGGLMGLSGRGGLSIRVCY